MERRTLIAGAATLPLAPAAAVAQEGHEAPGPIEQLLPEVRRREAHEVAWFEARAHLGSGDEEEPSNELIDWWCEPYEKIIETVPTTVREFAAKVEAALIVHRDMEVMGSTDIGEAIERDAKTILGPMAEDAPQQPTSPDPRAAASMRAVHRLASTSVIAAMALYEDCGVDAELFMKVCAQCRRIVETA